MAEWQQTQIWGFTSHKNLLSRGTLSLQCLATSSCQAAGTTACPQQTSAPSPTQRRKTPEMEVALKHQADTQSLGSGFKICSPWSHRSYEGQPRAPRHAGVLADCAWPCSAAFANPTSGLPKCARRGLRAPTLGSQPLPELPKPHRRGALPARCLRLSPGRSQQPNALTQKQSALNLPGASQPAPRQLCSPLPPLLGWELAAGMCRNTFHQLFVFRGCFLLAEHFEHAAPKASGDRGA